jgi:hypothetical protein
MERTGSRPTQFKNVPARGDKMQRQSDVQSSGMLQTKFPKRKTTRIPTNGLAISSAFKTRSQGPKFKPHKVVVK